MARSIRIPQLRHRLALAKAIACGGYGDDGQNRDDCVWEVSVEFRLCLLEHSKQEHADGNLASR